MTSTVSAARPAASPAPPGRTRALAGIALGYFMVLLDTTVLSVAEPDLARSFGGAGVTGLQWTVTGYTLVFGAALLTAGSVADRYGAHRVFRVAVAAFGLGSLLSALAPSLWALVGLRALLGLAAAGCVPASMAMIARLYPVPAERAKAVAVWAATSGAALVAGPVSGGALTDLAGWRAIFVINGPLAAVTLALTAGAAVRCPRGDRRIDWAAQILACAAVALLTDMLIALGARSFVHAAWSACATAVAVCAFAVRERRGHAPVLAPAVLRAPGVPGALLAGAAVNFAMSGVLFVLPLLFQQELGLTPGKIGAALLPMTLPFAVNPLLTGRIVARSGPRPPVLAGLGLLAAAWRRVRRGRLGGRLLPVAAGRAGRHRVRRVVRAARPGHVDRHRGSRGHRRCGRWAAQRGPAVRRDDRRRHHGRVHHRRRSRSPRRGVRAGRAGRGLRRGGRRRRPASGRVTRQGDTAGRGAPDGRPP